MSPPQSLSLMTLPGEIRVRILRWIWGWRTIYLQPRRSQPNLSFPDGRPWRRSRKKHWFMVEQSKRWVIWANTGYGTLLVSRQLYIETKTIIFEEVVSYVGRCFGDAQLNALAPLRRISQARVRRISGLHWNTMRPHSGEIMCQLRSLPNLQYVEFLFAPVQCSLSPDKVQPSELVDILSTSLGLNSSRDPGDVSVISWLTWKHPECTVVLSGDFWVYLERSRAYRVSE